MSLAADEHGMPMGSRLWLRGRNSAPWSGGSDSSRFGNRELGLASEERQDTGRGRACGATRILRTKMEFWAAFCKNGCRGRAVALRVLLRRLGWRDRSASIVFDDAKPNHHQRKRNCYRSGHA